MNRPRRLETQETLTLKGCAQVWRVGTGLAATLQPGVHRITRQTTHDGRSRVIIDAQYYLSEAELAKLVVQNAD